MTVNDSLLNKLENLSKLKIDESQREQREKEISDIINFVEVLNGLDVSSINATFSTLEGGTPFREDAPRQDDVIKTILTNAPKKEEGFFIVPKIIE